MSDRIQLTEAEREAAAEAAYIAHELEVRGDGKYAPWSDQHWSQTKWHQTVNSAIRAINKVRAGDPVGTLRRNPNGVVYERRERNGIRYWEALMPWPTLGLGHPIPKDPENVSDWQIIYSSEES